MPRKVCTPEQSRTNQTRAAGYCPGNWRRTKAHCPSFRTWSEAFNGTPDADDWRIDYLALINLGVRVPCDETAVLTLFQVIFATIASTMTVYLTSSDTVVSEKDSLFPPSNLASKEAAIPKSSSAAPKRVLCKYYRTAVISTHFRKTTPRDPVSAKSRVSLPAMSSEAS
jgi:hypothetical protein